MSGNVAEWCSDIFWLDPKLVTRVVSLIRPKDKEQQATPGTERTVRGGSWNSKAKEVQLSSRIGCLPDSCSNEIGFRLAIDAEELVIPDR
jgi:formylglycine-generating enzyme required for sulfatase activity